MKIVIGSKEMVMDCPACGSDENVDIIVRADGVEIECFTCDANSGLQANIKQAVRAWVYTSKNMRRRGGCLI